MQKILEQLKCDMAEYETLHCCRPDYVVLGWDLAYEFRRMKDVYRTTMSREYMMDVPVLETNITGVMALGTRCGNAAAHKSGQQMHG